MNTSANIVLAVTVVVIAVLLIYDRYKAKKEKLYRQKLDEDIESLSSTKLYQPGLSSKHMEPGTAEQYQIDSLDHHHRLAANHRIPIKDPLMQQRLYSVKHLESPNDPLALPHSPDQK